MKFAMIASAIVKVVGFDKALACDLITQSDMTDCYIATLKGFQWLSKQLE